MEVVGAEEDSVGDAEASSLHSCDAGDHRTRRRMTWNSIEILGVRFQGRALRRVDGGGAQLATVEDLFER